MSWNLSGNLDAVNNQIGEVLDSDYTNEITKELLFVQGDILRKFALGACPPDRQMIIDASGHIDQYSAYLKLEIKCYPKG